MTTPIERAAETLALFYDGPDEPRDYDRDAARAVFASIDLDALARAIHDHECGCAYDSEHTYADLDRRDALAQAVKAHLTWGAS